MKNVNLLKSTSVQDVSLSVSYMKDKINFTVKDHCLQQLYHVIALHDRRGPTSVVTLPTFFSGPN